MIWALLESWLWVAWNVSTNKLKHWLTFFFNWRWMKCVQEVGWINTFQNTSLCISQTNYFIIQLVFIENLTSVHFFHLKYLQHSWSFYSAPSWVFGCRDLMTCSRDRQSYQYTDGKGQTLIWSFQHLPSYNNCSWLPTKLLEIATTPGHQFVWSSHKDWFWC